MLFFNWLCLSCSNLFCALKRLQDPCVFYVTGMERLKVNDLIKVKLRVTCTKVASIHQNKILIPPLLCSAVTYALKRKYTTFI